ncbi:MAG: 2-dehydropantoate 2-reductase [Pseudomonadota bacterium]
MKICIYGAGAIGAHIGVSMKLAGRDVSVIARGDHLAAIQKQGLTLLIDGQEKCAKLPATSNPQDLGHQDIIIVTLKSHQAWHAADDIKHLMGPETTVVTAQNGIPWWYFYGVDGRYADMQLQSVDPGGRQWKAIGPERVVGCTVYTAAELIAPGVVKHAYGNRYGLGEPTRKTTPRLSTVAAAFEDAGFETKIYDEIRNDIWLKLWGNLCFNPLSALTHATLDVIATDQNTRPIARKMMEEAEVIANRIGAEFQVDIERRINGSARVGPHRTSMLQDLDKGRQIELDAILSVVQEIGRTVGVQTPTIDIVLGLTKQMGQTHGVYPVFPE